LVNIHDTLSGYFKVYLADELGTKNTGSPIKKRKVVHVEIKPTFIAGNFRKIVLVSDISQVLVKEKSFLKENFS
jgi:hypothetical protein